MHLNLPRPIFLRSIFLTLVLALVAPGGLSAADRYLAGDQTGDQHWNRAGGNDRFWREGRGTGGYVQRMESDATYHSEGRVLRTRDILDGVDAFGGGTLVMERGALQVKAGRDAVVKIDHLVARDTFVDASSTLPGGQPQTMEIGRLENSGTTVVRAKARRGLKIKIGTLTGDGVIRFEGADDTSVFQVDVGDASGFTGTFVTDGGMLYVITAETARPIPVSTVGGLL